MALPHSTDNSVAGIVADATADVGPPYAWQSDALSVLPAVQNDGGALRLSEIEPTATDRSPQGSSSVEAIAPGDDAAPAIGAPPEGAAQTGDSTAFLDRFDLLSAGDLIDKGGPVIVILLVLSVVATTVALIKFWQFYRLGVGSGRNADKALTMWIAGKHDQAADSIRDDENPCAFVLAHGMRGVSAGVEERIVREDVERVAMTELGKLRSYMRVIEATVQIAPLLGLFGTVIGMISAFQALQVAGSETNPAVLAGGIWVALLTTAVGLAIAIPAAFINHWFEGRIEHEKEHMEATLTSLFTLRMTGADALVAKSRSRKKLAHAAE